MAKRICFVTAGPSKWASSRMRGQWIADRLDNAIVASADQPLPDADVYIWIKGFDLDIIKERKEARHIWDVCDPIWWWHPRECWEMAHTVSTIVASNPALAFDFRSWCGKEPLVIPDRLLLDHYPLKRKHVHADPVRYIWYGAAQNRIGLFGVIASLERLAANGVKLQLTICDDNPKDRWGLTDMFPIYHADWSVEKENEIISAHDIALVPPYPGAWGLVKSNNKSLTAWACGLPATDGMDYDSLARLATETEYRKSEAKAGFDLLKTSYRIEQSVKEWKAIINE